MSHTLFISDLHLSAGQPQITAAFERFLNGPAREAEAVYILGDLFEYWAGDDDCNEPFNRRMSEAMRQLADHGVRLYLLHGNRDLLMGTALAQACHATLLEDPAVINLYGQTTVLSHGDALCTDDVEYQQFRNQVRNPSWQQQFLARPLVERKAYIEQLRSHSRSEKRAKSESIMDVNDGAVMSLLRTYGYPRLIHGHIHRPCRHVIHLDDHTCERWVLGDWSEFGHALRCDVSGCSVIDRI